MRESNGMMVSKFGICPATMERRLNGAHSGMNAGRACWVVAGTMCGNRIQGTFASKFKGCRLCDFYIAVMKEEGRRLLPPEKLLSRLDVES